jgi:hypothetical protein
MVTLLLYLGAWTKAARKAGIDKSEIDAVMKDVKSSDYSYLLATLIDNGGY